MVPQTILKGSVLAIVVALFLYFSSCTAMRQIERPNILFVMTDDMPDNLLYRLPEVDKRIVSEGIHFQNAYVSQWLCCPSWATILTAPVLCGYILLSNGGP